MLECGIRAKDTLELVTQEEMSEQKVSYTELERTRAKTGEVDLVKTLNDTKLEELYPASQREGYDEDEPQAEE